jgi:hypothetical protein
MRPPKNWRLRTTTRTIISKAGGALLSRELAQPAIETVRFSGPQRGVFTVGISGCGQRKTYQMICPEGGSGCFSADTLGNIR